MTPQNGTREEMIGHDVARRNSTRRGDVTWLDIPIATLLSFYSIQLKTPLQIAIAHCV